VISLHTKFLATYTDTNWALNQYQHKINTQTQYKNLHRHYDTFISQQVQ